MTQAPQTAPAGGYPSPDGAPVLRWWDGRMWTDATHPLPHDQVQPQQPPAGHATDGPPEQAPEREAVEAGPAASGWPEPTPPNLGALGLVTRVFVGLVGVLTPLAWAARGWRTANPPDWLTEDLAQTLVGTAAGLLVVAGVFWAVWQSRLAHAFPPGTPRRTPGWQVLSWLVPVGAWWLPYQNVADLFRLTTGRRPGWLPAWWALWVAGSLVTVVGGIVALGAPAAGAWISTGGSLLLTAAVPFAWLIVGRLTAAISRDREHPDA